MPGLIAAGFGIGMVLVAVTATALAPDDLRRGGGRADRGSGLPGVFRFV